MIQRLCIILILLILKKTVQSYFEGTQLLSDIKFDQGFDVIPACLSDPTECSAEPHYRLFNPFSTVSNGSASWEIVQWASRSNLSSQGTLMNDSISKGIQWATSDKSVILFQDGRMQLAMNAYHEYGGQYKAPNAPWVHLLMQQTIGRTHHSLPLSEVTELHWDLDVHLLYMDRHIQSCYNSNLHAAIFPLYMTIQNLVDDDPDYGKYFWLGIGVYDDRVPMTSLYVNGDAGTGSLIYSPAFSNFATTSVQSGSIVHVGGDMLPFVQLGLQAAVQRGFLRSNDLSRYYVGGMNVGWEITGLNIGTIELANISLTQYTAQNPRSYEFNFDRNQEGWTTVFDVEQFVNSPQNGRWMLRPKGSDPQILSPPLMLDTTVVTKLIIRISNGKQSEEQLQVFWNTNNIANSFSESASFSINIKPDDSWHEYTLNLSSNTNWHGIVRRLRIDPVRSGNGDHFGIDYIRFAS
ncbi:unnamed protein product [Rotaria magnacalcarata]|uniref:Uncharacterized protein n=2 Tax=Rotaria magnacalcarata TaxID=392030 RepID=A0A815Y0I4_9BILA|nr:unnamed protein product [Rotaria magnacalcarata]